MTRYSPEDIHVPGKRQTSADALLRTRIFAPNELLKELKALHVTEPIIFLQVRNASQRSKEPERVTRNAFKSEDTGPGWPGLYTVIEHQGTARGPETPDAFLLSNMPMVGSRHVSIGV